MRAWKRRDQAGSCWILKHRNEQKQPWPFFSERLQSSAGDTASVSPGQRKVGPLRTSPGSSGLGNTGEGRHSKSRQVKSR